MPWFLSCILPYPIGAESQKRRVYTTLFQISEESLSITKVLPVSQEERLTWDLSVRIQLNESNVSVEEDAMRAQRAQRRQEVIYKSWKVYFVRSGRWQLRPLNQNGLFRLQFSSGWRMLSFKVKKVATITWYSWYVTVTRNENKNSPLLTLTFPYNIKNRCEYLELRLCFLWRPDKGLMPITQQVTFV